MTREEGRLIAARTVPSGVPRPPLAGMIELRQHGDRFVIWHLRGVWYVVGSGEEAMVREWFEIASSTPSDSHGGESDPAGVSRPSRAIPFSAKEWHRREFGFDVGAYGSGSAHLDLNRPEDDGVPVGAGGQEPASDLQAIMEAAPGQTPAETVAERQTREAAAEGRVTAILSALTLKQKAVAALLAAGWSQSDAAREMGVSRQAIEQTVRRIRAALDSPETIDIRFEVTPTSHPERYYPPSGPPEPWCDFCTPTRRSGNWGHSGECGYPTGRIVWVRQPICLVVPWSSFAAGARAGDSDPDADGGWANAVRAYEDFDPGAQL